MASSPNREELLRMAIQSAKGGQKDGARMMFQQVLQQDKHNERALLWMAKIADTPGERRVWLERVLTVNPENEVAQNALDQMTYGKAAKENKKLFYFGGAAVGALMLITIIVAAAWAFAPLS